MRAGVATSGSRVLYYGLHGYHGSHGSPGCGSVTSFARPKTPEPPSSGPEAPRQRLRRSGNRCRRKSRPGRGRAGRTPGRSRCTCRHAIVGGQHDCVDPTVPLVAALGARPAVPAAHRVLCCPTLASTGSSWKTSVAMTEHGVPAGIAAPSIVIETRSWFGGDGTLGADIAVSQVGGALAGRPRLRRPRRGTHLSSGRSRWYAIRQSKNNGLVPVTSTHSCARWLAPRSTRTQRRTVRPLGATFAGTMAAGHAPVMPRGKDTKWDTRPNTHWTLS